MRAKKIEKRWNERAENKLMKIEIAESMTNRDVVTSTMVHWCRYHGGADSSC